MTLHALGADAARAPAVAHSALRGKIEHRVHDQELAMASDRFDHVFVEPASSDVSLAFYRDALGWSWFVARDPDGNLIAFEQRL
jgi:hypothetical protein